MQFDEKINQLSKIIANELLKIITKNNKQYKCIYLELPYYTNIGDVLIWHGTEHFLKQAGLKCIYRASRLTYSGKKMKSKIKQSENISNKKTLIFLQGGGNFGDLWIWPHDFRKKIIEEYPDNPIVILPQTVFYENENNIKNDAELFAKHKNLTICTRDNRSYKMLKDNFKNEIILVPDMAFCIPMVDLKKYSKKQKNKILFLKRNDKELNKATDYLNIISEQELDVCDWPTMEKMMFAEFFLRCFLWINRKIPGLFYKLTDIYASLFFKPNMIKIGVRFISSYKNIYTTRLHVAILCCLLGKKCTFFDNSYGKNGSFFETWLNDLDGIKFIK